MPRIRLGEIAYARSGDKGSSENIGILAFDRAGYDLLVAHLTAERVHAFFAPYGVTKTVRYELPNLLALNFVLSDVLDGGGSVSLRIDAQGKAMGQALLELELDVPEAGVNHA
ncbi:MAG: hypothetical protein NZ561_02830 [Phycisphaerae bacterium]|nr:hypothetical protein [Phycisphaerae bacterium]MDW8261962.1 hypothetical protein [Phycisphaerales bacterium]